MTETELDRFLAKTVRSPNGCLTWTGAKAHGYGRVSIGGRVRQAHVVYWEHVYGQQMPPGMDLDHACHNQDGTCLGGQHCEHKSCVEPTHLVPKTRSENIRDARRPFCRNGHMRTPENTRTGSKGEPICRICHSLRSSESKKAKKTHCPKGHPYSAENMTVTRHGRRMCLTCAASKAQLMREAKAAKGSK